MKKHDHKKMLHLYDEWLTSGESKSSFATRHGIERSTFYYWVKKLQGRRSAAEPGKGFGAISIKDPDRIDQGPAIAVIHYPSGARLELHIFFEARFLKTLLE